MTTARKSFLRDVMKMAWSFYRAEPTRGFSDSLRGAWKMMRKLSAGADRFLAKARNSRHVLFSPSLIRSPIARSLTGQSLSAFRDHKAARTTALVGN